MRLIIAILFIFVTSNFANNFDETINEYRLGNFKKVCLQNINKIIFIKNEAILSIVGDACSKSDYINPLGDVIKRMVTSKEYRENASYFATILLQKKLIYQFMNDDINLHDIKLPRTSHLLSIVFENIVKKNYKILNKNPKKLEINLKNKKYIVWLKEDNPSKVVIDVYIDGNLSKRHWYL